MVAYSMPEGSKKGKTEMAMTQAQPDCSAVQTARSTKPPLAKCPTPLVPESTVKEMLREIAYVLHASRRLAEEITDENCR